MKRLQTYFILILLLCSVDTAAYNNVSYNANVYGIGASAPAGVGRTQLSATGNISGSNSSAGLAVEPVATVGGVRSQSRGASRRASYRANTQYHLNSRSSATYSYPVYRGHSQQTLHSYGGSAQMNTGGYTSGNSSNNTASASVAVITLPAVQRKVGKAVAAYDIEQQYVQLEESETRTIGKMFAPPTQDGGIDEDLWNTFHDAWLYTDDEGVNYYDEQTLYELWLKYIEEHGGQMPGEGNTGYTWDDLIQQLRDNTANQDGNSRLPLNGGTAIMIMMAIGYAVCNKIHKA